MKLKLCYVEQRSRQQVQPAPERHRLEPKPRPLREPRQRIRSAVAARGGQGGLKFGVRSRLSALARTRSVAAMRSLVQRRPDKQYVAVPRPPEPAPELSNAALARRLAREVAEEPITAPGVTGAQQGHQRGLAHYNAGRFQKAFDAFAEAHRLNPISTFLHDQATCLERMGRNAEAAEMYERYLASGPLSDWRRSPHASASCAAR